jgi:hypothetical protein
VSAEAPAQPDNDATDAPINARRRVIANAALEPSAIVRIARLLNQRKFLLRHRKKARPGSARTRKGASPFDPLVLRELEILWIFRSFLILKDKEKSRSFLKERTKSIGPKPLQPLRPNNQKSFW